ncbi:hypothetical protein [Bacteriovorax sp. Seq25_V]|uniref:hypothetical protein n=1 Tax=Bacteriovorax sp. Seq25_V TaxID=1201288 RepID=UPI00038A504C|nr:hypothetical protein [Bacteriovorax sp. Seq25_V]EQC43911.1 hypothetical protein M900_1178 [Bacteriovorax sp. Seq25_V]
MRKLIIAIAMTFAALNASAVNLAFKFEVTSSGNSMYACNAGLKHADPAGRVCYDRQTLNSCNPVLCKDGQACDCVCTGGFTLPNNGRDDGEYRLDFFNASYANWTDNGEAPTNIQYVRKTAGKNSAQTAINAADTFSTQLLSLDFNLGSERYGAEYFVDVCFRATQIDYPSSNTYANGDKLNWAIDRGVTITDLSSDLGDSTHVWDLDETDVIYSLATYETSSALQVKATLYCKDKDGSLVFNEETAYTTFDAAQKIKFASRSTKADLKGCIVRYTFKETNVDGISSVRKWKAQKARICTYTSVNEAE